MAIAESSAVAPFAARAAHQFSLWPFGTRTVRLFVLVDLSADDPSLVRGLLRAMQHEFFVRESGSQTTAVRRAIHAAHYVLRHHNRDRLADGHATASAVVAAARDGEVYVALAGNTVAFAWSAGSHDLAWHHGAVRLARPLGTELEPDVRLWSAPFGPGDRLALVCGAAWRDGSLARVDQVLSTYPTYQAQERLGEVLGRPHGLPRVLVAEGLAAPRRTSARPPDTSTTSRTTSRQHAPIRRFGRIAALAAVALTTIAVLAVASTLRDPIRVGLAQQAEALLDQAQLSRDAYAAHGFAEQARDLAAQAQQAGLVQRATSALQEIDRVYSVDSLLVLRTGQGSIDLAVAPDRLYLLDGEDGRIRTLGLDRLDQPAIELLSLRRGEKPVAIEYVVGPDGGQLTVIDRMRNVVQIQADGAAIQRPLPSSLSWQELGAIGSDQSGNLYVLDSGARRLLMYPRANERLVDPPRPLLDARSAPTLAFEHIVQLTPLDDLYVLQDDGSPHRLDRQGHERGFVVRPPDGGLGPVSAMTVDLAGGLYLADPTHARIVQTTADGRFVRQFRQPELGGIRQIHLARDGRQLFGLIPEGLLVLRLPAEVPAPLSAELSDTGEPPPAATQIAK